MDKIEIYDKSQLTQVIDVGSIRLECYLHEGKTVITANALNAKDFIVIQPISGNKIAIKADHKIAM